MSATVPSDVPDAEELTRRSSDLTRSFSLCAVMFVLSLIAPAVLKPPYAGRSAVLAGLLSLALIGSYVWYAVSAGKAAKALGGSGWLYVTWILAAPFVALVVTFVPLLPTAISASPLSIKFLLGNQLDEALRNATTMHLHRT